MSDKPQDTDLAAQRKARKAAQKKEREEKAKARAQQAGPKPKKGKGKAAQVRLRKDFVNPTPAGELKDMSTPMPDTYDPAEVEAAWYEWWEKKGFFKSTPKSGKENFVMVIPPPNVTGALHLGHALTVAIEDSLTRWHRMSGREALWVPGVDHAGIATQTVVERKLMLEEGKTKQDLGRDEFVKKVWEWKEDYGGRITGQLRRLGVSVDWDRFRFTMDDMLSEAVLYAFEKMFDDGMIYRDTRLVNWCCTLKTAISDIEVDHKELEKRSKLKVPGYDEPQMFGRIDEFQYKVKDSDELLTIATTRLETMLGDTAVAIHPEDPRYKHLHGKSVVHPFNGRELPIILDDVLVDMSFGTGVVKITPAHDPNDYECGRRHNLEFINILNDDGTMNSHCGEFEGMPRFKARIEVLKKLKAMGQFVGVKDNKMSIGICSRSGDIIEPVIKPQWYIKCKEMGLRAAKAVREGDMKIHPEQYEKTWFQWTENLRDWCISRQLWWGHRCPVYLVRVEGEEEPNPNETSSYVSGKTEEIAMEKAKAKFPSVDPSKITLEQDPDVLDTWFSSGLFPFAVFGWPNKSEDLDYYFPTSLLETGHDIIFFWVARMVIFSQYFMDKLPFKDVFLHAMVRDAKGRKMSKTRGNVLDPIDLIEGALLETLNSRIATANLAQAEKDTAIEAQSADFPFGISECGTDAMRFALCNYTQAGRSINLDVNKVIALRNFCNKLWNIVKFCLMHLGEEFKAPESLLPTGNETSVDKWILTRMNDAVREADAGFKSYSFSTLTDAIHNFWLNDLASTYLEAIKTVMKQDDEQKKETVKHTLYTCLHVGLRMLHPFMCFVTEELYHRIPRRESDPESIMIAEYPLPNDAYNFPNALTDIEQAQQVVGGLRSVAGVFAVSAKKPEMWAVLTSDDEEWARIIKDNAGMIETLARSKAFAVTTKDSPPPVGCAIEMLNEHVDLYVMVKGHVNFEVEISKLSKKNEKTKKQLAGLEKKIASKNFSKMPEDVQQSTTESLGLTKADFEKTQKLIDTFSKLAVDQ